jgi:hypothetical protein
MDSSGTIYQFVPDGSAEVLIEEVRDDNSG